MSNYYVYYKGSKVNVNTNVDAVLGLSGLIDNVNSNILQNTNSIGIINTSVNLLELQIKNGGGSSGDTPQTVEGKSISSIVLTTESNADGGVNIWTATLSDGTTSTLRVRNGTKGNTGSGGSGSSQDLTGYATIEYVLNNFISNSLMSDYATIEYVDSHISSGGSSGGSSSYVIDTALSTTSTNPVLNKVITNALNNKQNKLTSGSLKTINGNGLIGGGDIVINANSTYVRYAKQLEGTLSQADITYILSSEHEDKIYEIIGDLDLNNATLTPAKGACFKFSGGKIIGGTIDGRNGIYIDCPNCVFFNNMKFVNINSELIWQDYWFDNVFTTSFIGISRIALSKDYSLTTTEITTNNSNAANLAEYDKMIIYGNDHIITLPKFSASGTKFFIRSRYVELHDLNIVLSTESYLGFETIVDANIGIFYNVSFSGNCDFIKTKTNPNPSDIYELYLMYPLLRFYGCEIKTNTLVANGAYNIVIANDSKFYRNSSTYTSNTIFSTSPFGYNEQYELDSYIELYDCYIEGGWETPNNGRVRINGTTSTYYYGSSKTQSTYTKQVTYKNVYVNWCELVMPYIGYKKAFSTTLSSYDSHAGTTDKIELNNCKIYTGTPDGLWLSNLASFRKCNITLMQNNSSGSFPFTFILPTLDIKIISCVFDCTSYTSKSLKSWNALDGGGAYSDGDTDKMHYILPLTISPGDDFVLILKANTFIQNLYKTKVYFYCDKKSSASNNTARIKCTGNTYSMSTPRDLGGSSNIPSNANMASCYGILANGYWSTQSSTIYLLPIDNSEFNGSEDISSFDYTVCVHDFNFYIKNIYNSTTSEDLYFIFDSLYKRILKQTVTVVN